MDLRIVKTRKGIREAFLNLRKNYIPEQIKVKDICSMALINKTTFYKHYTDVFDLNKQIEEEAIDVFMDALVEKDCLFEDPEKFIRAIARVAEEKQEYLQPVFRGSYDKMFQKLEKRFADYYRNLLGDDADEVMITFAIGGISYTLRELYFKKETRTEKILSSVTSFINKVQEKYKKPASQNI